MSYDIEHGVSLDDANAQLRSKRCREEGIKVNSELRNLWHAAIKALISY